MTENMMLEVLVRLWGACSCRCCPVGLWLLALPTPHLLLLLHLRLCCLWPTLAWVATRL
jgi:hypothetical protein